MDTVNDVANAEWPESASCHRVRTATADPTPTQVDVNKSISTIDLKSLKKQDPFLYYSISILISFEILVVNISVFQLSFQTCVCINHLFLPAQSIIDAQCIASMLLHTTVTTIIACYVLQMHQSGW